MTHEEVRVNLPLYADGELEPQVAEVVEARLAQSPELRAELERWRALRSAVNRALSSAALPAGLESRVRERLRDAGSGAKVNNPRIIRLAGALTAIAAAVVLMVTFWNPDTARAEPLQVAPVRFAEVYRGCALKHSHHGLKAGCSCLKSVRDELQNGGDSTAPVLDLVGVGYTLDGVCRCFKVPDVKVVHAHYRSNGPKPTVVSLFAVARQVSMRPCRKCGDCRINRGYEVATDGGVNVCKWDGLDAETSFALCSDMAQQPLHELADAVRTALENGEPPAIALAMAMNE